jgi:hypothetical protein
MLCSSPHYTKHGKKSLKSCFFVSKYNVDLYCNTTDMNKPILDLTIREMLTLISGYAVITIGVIALLCIEPIVESIFS